MTNKKTIGLVLSTIALLVLWLLPSTAFGINDLSVVEQRVIAIFAFAAIMWISEAIPIWATSVLIIVIMLLSVSTSSVWFLIPTDTETQAAGELIKYKDIMATFADPIIMLFLGGFVLAIAAKKCDLDANLARVLLKPFGTKSHFVLLGFIVITALFSMFMSNTATAAMMVTILAPILKATDDCNGSGKVGLALAIPIAANIGGIGTPVGTPPNAIALKYLNDPEGLNLNIGFGEWMMVMVPFVIILLLISWFLLLKMFPFNEKNIVIKIEGEMRKDKDAIIVYVVFAVTVLLWMLDKVTGVNANVVALIPVAVLTMTGIIKKNDLKEIPWDVLWLVAGGFALGVGMDKTGLAEHLVKAIPFETWPTMVTIIGSGVLCLLMSTFISNTATAALLVPILAAVGAGIGTSLDAFGGITSLLVGIALCASLAMALPISTPPNALAHSTGLVKQSDMAKVGVIIGVIGLIMTYSMLLLIGKYIF
ncbi:MAG: SLC13/DASS family transporter [Paludibacteraceae bacterium]|nr:SLC13/DASS family transporter [Paludibacteraceae bacterium]